MRGGRNALRSWLATAPDAELQTSLTRDLQPQADIRVRGTAATINLPPVLTIDVGQRLISGAATGRTIKITSADRDAGRLLISGSESGGSWSVAIIEDSGAMSAVALVRNGGFLMFGTCSSN